MNEKPCVYAKVKFDNIHTFPQFDCLLHKTTCKLMYATDCKEYIAKEEVK
jgi:hypothetical protein